MNSKKIIKPAFSILVAFSLVFTSNVVYASELDNTNNSNDSEYVSIGKKLESLLPQKTEEVKEITNIEELDTKVLNNDSDSAFKSCCLIIYSDKDMEFKDIKGRNNIKKVQKLDKMYIVQYASAKDTEDAYNFYTSLGVEVEIDVVNNTPEGVENKDGENQDVRNEEIASTNETKPTESVDRVKEENKDIVVAVLDSGLNNGDEIFNDKLVEGKNFVDENSDKTDDVYGHGTTMARVVLDTTNSSNIKIMPIKVLNDEGKGTTLSAYKGIKYAIEKNVDVINLSMSGIGHSKLLESAINEAVNLGIPVVVSAGNDNKEITEYTPANIESAIAVSSAYENILEDGKVEYLKSFYSNYGSDTNNIDFATNGHFEYKRNINNKEVTTKAEGTSVSAAYVTSFIAMLKAMALTDEDTNNDKLSFNDVYASLSESAIKQEDVKTFGNGFLKKDNFKLVKSEKEEEQLPVENVDNVTEDIVLDADLARDTSACIIDGQGFACNSTTEIKQKLEQAYRQKNGKSIKGWAEQDALGFALQLLNCMFLSNDPHEVFFNDNFGITLNPTCPQLKINVTSGTRKREIISVASNSNIEFAGISIWSENQTGYANQPIITIAQGTTVNFKDGCISYTKAQKSTTPYLLDSEKPNFKDGTRPSIENKGNLTLNGTSLRAGGMISGSTAYVLKNTGTVTLDGGGSLEGGARDGSTASLLENSGTANIYHYVLDASWILSNANMRPANAIKNTKTCNVYGGSWCAIGAANTGINNSGTCTIYGQGTTLIHGSQKGIDNTNSLEIRNGNVTDNAEGIYNAGSSAKLTYKGGNVQFNTLYGITNTSSATVNHTGGFVSFNGYNGNKVRQNTTAMGVNNYSTYNLSGGKIENNSNTGINNGQLFAVSNVRFPASKNATLSMTLSSSSIKQNDAMGIANNGTATIFGGYIQSTGTYTDASNRPASGPGYGIYNTGTVNQSGGYICNNNNYGINNTSSGTVNHSGGSIYHNAGGRVVNDTNGEDTTDAGVYQNGTYNISETAKVYDNAIYLVSGSKKVKQFNPNTNSNTFNGSAILTTGQNDRTLGRELVTNSKSTDSSKYTLAYGNYNGKNIIVKS